VHYALLLHNLFLGAQSFGVLAIHIRQRDIRSYAALLPTQEGTDLDVGNGRKRKVLSLEQAVHALYVAKIAGVLGAQTEGPSPLFDQPKDGLVGLIAGVGARWGEAKDEIIEKVLFGHGHVQRVAAIDGERIEQL